MEMDIFKRSAAFIAQRNVSQGVAQVLAEFNSEKGSLKLVYCVEDEVTDEDWEDVELTCAELIAEFPEIVHAETDCRSITQCHDGGASIVYTKPV